MTQTSPSNIPICVNRVEVRPAPDQPDPVAEQAQSLIRAAFEPPLTIRSARVYLIQGPLNEERATLLAEQLLCDPICQRYHLGVEPPLGAVLEVHYLPGVMDPAAESTRRAILEALPQIDPEALSVRTGWRYDLIGPEGQHREQLLAVARAQLANPVVHAAYDRPFQADAFPEPTEQPINLLRLQIRDLSDEALLRLSRSGHLFLDLAEMRAIQAYYRQAGREPTDIELETLAQTWSEHCVHKTLKSRVRYTQQPNTQGPGPADFAHRPGHTLEEDGTLIIDNLLRRTIAAATFRLMEEDESIRRWCVSVFDDNSGVVRFDEQDGVCIKVETHNHPSALEPYGGAATGIGGCIRDILGTGQVAWPIANTDVFCVAPPDTPASGLPRGVIHPRRTLERVVAGVRDYGNRMGIPTINGAVLFHENYLANPLVFAGCVGLIPLDRSFGDAQRGDRIVVLGGRTGRDGIHGATFSSAELTDTHADEFAHAVQIGNPITQKKLADALVRARDAPGGPLFNAVTDCGAGGFSSAIGEMGQHVGAAVRLDAAPLKYPGLSYTEIWISEAQERMVLSVPEAKLEDLRAICQAEDVELADLGFFGCYDEAENPLLLLGYAEREVGRLGMRLVHDGLPTPQREAHWPGVMPRVGSRRASAVAGRGPLPLEGPNALGGLLRGLLADPDIASKHWIIRQYDHEVQGGSVVKPLVGPHQDGPSDAAVVRPKLASEAGVVLASGLCPWLADPERAQNADPYWMALGAIDEAVRNAVCVGADPSRIAILDNFCWPGCQDPALLAALVRAAEACYDGALAYRTPFVSGKDSLNNQYTAEDGTKLAIPPTLLITAMGYVDTVRRCVTMDAKAVGSSLLIVGATGANLGGSKLLHRTIQAQPAPSADERPTTIAGGEAFIPCVDLTMGPRIATAVGELIRRGLVASAHDCSEGGLLVAAAEMAFTGRIGLEVNLGALPLQGASLDPIVACFAETPHRYLLEVSADDEAQAKQRLTEAGVPFAVIGRFIADQRLNVRGGDGASLLDQSLDDLRQAWLKPLDW